MSFVQTLFGTISNQKTLFVSVFYSKRTDSSQVSCRLDFLQEFLLFDSGSSKGKSFQMLNIPIKYYINGNSKTVEDVW